MNTRGTRLFVTGLCMQGNKGGPALALSLVDAIRREIPDAQFAFSVPGAHEEWVHEARWAARYGFEVCRNASLAGMLPPFCFGKDRLHRFLVVWRKLRSCDALVQMSAICYLGPPAGPGTLRAMLSSPRWFDFVLSFLARRPMLAWTQSYGPLSNATVRFFAKWDLRRQPLVFCRGDDCAAAVKNLLPNAKAMSFPDVAVTLECDPAWGREYVRGRFPSMGRFVTLSPSAVMYGRDPAPGARNRHVRQCREICARLAGSGYTVLLLPHTMRPSRHDPKVCDLAVAEIVDREVASEKVLLVNDDLAPGELKAIIANAAFHVGARYHSVVAALSSGVPAISLSWHPKYRDLMRTYGLEDYVADESDDHSMGELLPRMEREESALRPQLGARQSEAARAVRENARLFCGLLRNTERGK
jgi:polysaccharide pyruvyl transferase WcaK-like protein